MNRLLFITIFKPHTGIGLLDNIYINKSDNMYFNYSHKLLTISVAVALCASATAQSDISENEMQRVFEEVKTPYKQGVVIRPDGEGKMVDCPSVFRAGGRWCMTYVQYDGRGYETWLAKSDDLLHWTTVGRLTQLPAADAAGIWDRDQRGGFPALQDMTWEGSYELQKYEGNYWMSYIGSSTAGYEGLPISIGLASTRKDPDKVHLWQTSKQPVMRYDDSDVKPWESRSPSRALFTDRIFRDTPL